MKIIFALFIILHGAVHLLYFAQSNRYFALKPGMTWPSGSWVFTNFLSDHVLRIFANVLLVLTSFGFIASGVGILIDQSWWRAFLIASSLLSSFIYVVFWNGKNHNLDGQGLIAIVIDIAMIILAVFIHWP